MLNTIVLLFCFSQSHTLLQFISTLLVALTPHLQRPDNLDTDLHTSPSLLVALTPHLQRPDTRQRNSAQQLNMSEAVHQTIWQHMRIDTLYAIAHENPAQQFDIESSELASKLQPLIMHLLVPRLSEELGFSMR